MGQLEVKNAPSLRRSLNQTVRVSLEALRGDRWDIHRVSLTARVEQKRAKVWHFLGAKQDPPHLPRDSNRSLRQPAHPSAAKSVAHQQQRIGRERRRVPWQLGRGWWLHHCRGNRQKSEHRYLMALRRYKPQVH